MTIAGFVALALSIAALLISLDSLRLAKRALRLSLEELAHTRQKSEAKRTTDDLPHWRGRGLPYPDPVPLRPGDPPRVIKDDM